MKILFLSLDSFDTYETDNMYSDLLREAINRGHDVFSVIPSGKEGKSELVESMGSRILKLYTGQVTGNTNFIKKGIATLRLGGRYKHAVKKYCKGEKFDLILYATPPITIYKAIKYAKKKTGAKTYLLLKDIFPQNAVDLGILGRRGLKGIITRYFRSVEKKYYAISDRIGCMSRRNVEYLLEHNPSIGENKVCINPNTVDVSRVNDAHEDSEGVRNKYSIPQEARIFIYGGNLGRPQDVPFIVECLKANADKPDRFFIISGKGGDYGILKAYFDEYKPTNMALINGLPKNEYNELVSVCDVGLIFLAYRFTIPNYPSRLLSYMQYGLPVISCTDESTDVGDDIVRGEFGWKCYSNDVAGFTAAVDAAVAADLAEMKHNSACKLSEWFLTKDSMDEILSFAESKP